MHMKEMLQIIKFVMMMPTKGLRFKPECTDGAWRLEALSDSDAVAAILVTELHPEQPLPFGQMVIRPNLIGDRWWGSG